MERVADLAAFFKIPAMLCVNKFDLNPDEASAIEAFAQQKQIKVMDRIPFDPIFTMAMVQGKNIFEYDGHSKGAEAVRKLWDGVAEALGL